jgi:ferritin-like metal-binding protein YciE
MIDHAEDARLKQAFQSHLQETEVHVTRLEKLIANLERGAADKKDPIITAIIGSGENITNESDTGPIRDADLIATAQEGETL